MARHKNADWNLPEKVETWIQAEIACLMDLRDELQAIAKYLYRLVVVLECEETRRIPRLLRSIARNGHKQKRGRRAAGRR